MARPRTIQELIHWLEIGEGARWIRVAATLFGVLVLSLLVTWKQFRGATSEATLLQADVGRQLAAGRGFSTQVIYPQTVAFMAKRGVSFDPQRAYPELHQAPLYSMVIAGALRLLPASVREGLFASPSAPQDGYGGDYALLWINLALLWLAAWVTFDLARRLFDGRTAWLAMLAMLVSVGVWQQTMAVTGAALLMLLAVTAFWLWVRADAVAEATGRAATGWLAALGAACGLLFLTEYSAGALILVALGYAAMRFDGRARWAAVGMVALGFAVVIGPWVARNIALTGHPVALAAQNVALKFGDPTAEPANQRNLLSAAWPEIDLNKLGNKTLTSLQEDLKSRLWAGGAMWLAAFFVAGWLYAFRSAVANRMRGLFVAALAVWLLAQASLNSGESDRLAAGWLAPLIIVFGAGFFFVLLGSNATLGQWPRACAAALLIAQALPLVHDVMAPPPAVRFQYPPYFPGLFASMRRELEHRDTVGRFGVMADVPAGAAWYGRQRVWSQPVKLRDFYAITLEQPVGELLLTPRTLDRPFFSELGAHPAELGLSNRVTNRFGDWGRIYAGLLTGVMPSDFPLNAPVKLSENLYVIFNPALPPARGK